MAFTDWQYAEYQAEEAMAAVDDQRERYGDPCRRHGTLRWGGDCPACLAEADELREDCDALLSADLSDDAPLPMPPVLLPTVRIADDPDDIAF